MSTSCSLRFLSALTVATLSLSLHTTKARAALSVDDTSSKEATYELLQYDGFELSIEDSHRNLLPSLISQSPLSFTDSEITDILTDGEGIWSWAGSEYCDRYQTIFSEDGEYINFRRDGSEWRLAGSASMSRFSVKGGVMTMIDGRSRNPDGLYPPYLLDISAVGPSRIDVIRPNGDTDFLESCATFDREVASDQLNGSDSTGSSETILRRQGSLDEGDEQLGDGSFYEPHDFIGRTGQSVLIQMNSNAFDPYLLLYGPNGQKISENDDTSQENRNSSIAVVLPTDGNYSVFANSYDESGRGSYTLTVSNVGSDSSQSQRRVASNDQPSNQNTDGGCNTALAQLKQDLVDGRQLSIPYQTELEAYGDHPEGRSVIHAIAMEGAATFSVLNSPQLLASLSASFLQNCSSASAVQFALYQSGERRIVGLVGNQIINFQCAGEAYRSTQSGPGRRPPWGYYQCSF